MLLKHGLAFTFALILGSLSLTAGAEVVREVLPNGLRVVLVPDRSTPVVAVNVWYRVGGKDDPNGRSGFAHLFEHLMFKQAGALPDEGIDRLTEDVGGENNAFTSFDVTSYFESIPSPHLERLLWAESERLRDLRVNEKNFKSERDVVKEERRQNYDNNPEGLAELALWELAFSRHPYKNNVIGSIAALDSATLTEVLQFHNDYYQPQNAVLVVAGDLEPQQTLAWVKQYFGPLPNRGAVPRVTLLEPPLAGPRSQTLRSPLVSQPSVTLAYRVPNQYAADATALQLLPYLLSEGNGARLNQALINSNLAIAVASGAELLEQGGLYTIRATAKGQSLTPVNQAITRTLDQLRQKGPARDELNRAKTKYLTDLLNRRQTPLSRALAYGEAELWFQDPTRVDQEVARIQKLTPRELQRVIQTYFIPKNQITVTLLPEKK